MRESQYIDEYLELNSERGIGNGYTIGTFLTYRLSGNAKKYSQGYERALLRAVNRRLRSGEAFVARSAGGRVAAYKNFPLAKAE